VTNVHLVKTPLIDHYVGVIRDELTNKNDFATAIENIVYLMSSHITSDVELGYKRVNTPVAEATVAYFFDKILVIPILRAGLAMLEPIRKILPMSICGYIGIKRLPDLTADMYYRNLPPNLADYRVVLLETVIGTGSTLDCTIEYLISEGVDPKKLSVASIICARKGLEELAAKHKDVNFVVAAIDEILDERGYIVPGLGDAGDRYNGYSN